MSKPRTNSPAVSPADSQAVAPATARTVGSSAALVPAVDRAIRLLDALAAARQPSSLSELTRSLGLPKSSVHGLLHTLVGQDLATRTTDHEFRLGPRVLRWADAYRLQSDLIGAFNEQAATLVAEQSTIAGDTVMLAVLDGADVLYLACRPGSSPLAVNFRVGGRLPATCTSSGKAMLATLSPPEVRACLQRKPLADNISGAPLMVRGDARATLPKMTRHSVATHSALTRQLVQIRQQGFAIDDEETAEGMQCFGAPIIGAGDPRAVAAVAVSLIKASVTARRSNETIAAIRELARRLSERLGNPAAALRSNSRAQP